MRNKILIFLNKHDILNEKQFDFLDKLPTANAHDQM